MSKVGYRQALSDKRLVLYVPGPATLATLIASFRGGTDADERVDCVGRTAGCMINALAVKMR